MRVLGIETSCDETAVSIIEAEGDATTFSFRILGQALLSQVATHAPHGGVFPALAKREHAINLVPLLGEALREAGMHTETPFDMSAHRATLNDMLGRETELRDRFLTEISRIAKPDIDAIAVTYGPGLEPALWVGINFAKALALVWNLPLVPVNHMEGHIVLSAVDGHTFAPFSFPLLSLLISGGHTELVLSREWMQYELIGQTRDDAVGEAFDKVARLLGLPYPGGPEISKLAAIARKASPDSPLTLPRPMIDSPDYDFSFAGLKTAVRRVVESKETLSDTDKMHIAREFEDAAADVLVAKTMKAIDEYGAQTVLVGGGVSANTHIRTALSQAIKDYGYSTKLLIPPPELATDNALMIALAGYFRAHAGHYAQAESIIARGNLKLA